MDNTTISGATFEETFPVIASLNKQQIAEMREMLKDNPSASQSLETMLRVKGLVELFCAI